MSLEVSNEEFWKEVRVLAQLRHPNIVQTLAVSSQVPPMIVMEKMCVSFHDRLHKTFAQRPPWSFSKHAYARRKIGNVLLQVAQALCFLHTSKPVVVHQDLKPQNVLLDIYGNAKLCDFGISQLLSRHARVLKLSEVFGSPSYAAPELFEGFSSSAVDIYAFGVLTWEAVAGQLPWDGFPGDAIARCVQAGNRPSLQGVAENLQAFISACWHQDKSKRPICDQIIHALKRLGARHLEPAI
mmetsp:Transcript_19380/g.34598  ORF Transcript_19380/g.34598 Transcript_19380/m.34598 type:complete len:240 (-) Transcript_19380:178-897(-)